MLIIVSVLMVFSLQAQDRDQDRDHVRLRDYLVCKDGTVLQIRDRDQTRLQDKITLDDGTVVNADGSYIAVNGDRLHLRNGECMDMDGNKYNSVEQFQKNIQARTQAMNQLHYVCEDGKMYQCQNMQRTQLQEQKNFQNGSSITPDGNFRVREQLQLRLQNGECLDEEGNFYGNEMQFRKQEQLRMEAMNQEHFMFQDGNMYRFQNGKQIQMQNQVTLRNGMEVDPDGTFQMRDQERVLLRNGECVDPNGNVFKTQGEFLSEARAHVQAMKQEHFLSMNGNIYQVQNQDRFQLRDQMRLQNGMILNPDGTYQIRNQKQERLRDGECLDPDGNKYQNQQEFHNQMQTKFQAMNEPHFMYQNGKMYRIENQAQSQLRQRWMLDDGTVVNPDGSLQMQNGKRDQLRNGECLDWEGRRYENQDRFRERMEQRVRDRMQMRDRDMMDRRKMDPQRRGRF